MEFTIETEENTSRIAIISIHQHSFTQELASTLKQYHTTVFQDSTPDSIDSYDIVFLINRDDIDIEELIKKDDKRFIIVLFQQGKYAEYLCDIVYKSSSTHIKVLNLYTQKTYLEKDIEKVLWFSFSQTPDIFLYIYNPPVQKSDTPKIVKSPRLTHFYRKLKRPRSLIGIGIMLVIFSQIAFVLPLSIATVSNYSAGKALMSKDISSAQLYTKRAQSQLDTSRQLYRFSEPFVRFINLGFSVDTFFQLNESGIIVNQSVAKLTKNASILFEEISIQHKSDSQVDELKQVYTESFTLLDELKKHASIISTQLPTWHRSFRKMKTQIDDQLATLSQIEELAPFLEKIVLAEEEKKYLLLFANNMELRPGGGFIGSFAIVKTQPFTLAETTVYDVYDADGQLTDRIKPPTPISEYLNQPFWFLRDSAFSPDFPQNAQEAEQFLSLELQEQDFDGVILLTTTAIRNLLFALDEVYVPDYQETITAENFYLKTQLHAEEDFFPGSQNKKRFVASVMNQLLLALPQASGKELVDSITTSLNEKQVVLFMDDKKLQEMIDSSYWAGRMLTPQCTISDAVNCVLDYVYVVEANLGVNKANYYINRPTRLEVTIDEEGSIKNSLVLEYENGSFPDVFPGGTYKNYLQVYLPPNSQVDTLLVDGNRPLRVDESNIDYRSVGFYLEIPAQSTSTILLEYTLPTRIIQGEGVYQLLLQKQVGYANSELEFSVTVPDSVVINKNNITPLVNTQNIDYNTTISSDKIFVFEFTKYEL